MERVVLVVFPDFNMLDKKRQQNTKTEYFFILLERRRQKPEQPAQLCHSSFLMSTLSLLWDIVVSSLTSPQSWLFGLRFSLRVTEIPQNSNVNSLCNVRGIVLFVTKCGTRSDSIVSVLFSLVQCYTSQEKEFPRKKSIMVRDFIHSVPESKSRSYYYH